MTERQFNYPQRKRGNAEPTTRDVNAAVRAVQALKMRAQGMSYDEIAVQCSFKGGRGAAHKAVQRELQRVVVTNVDELRREELHRLELMHQEIWLMFTDRKNKGRLFAADRLLAIMERRAKLMGLDVPVDNALMSNVVVVREVPQLLGIVEQGQ